MVGLHVGEIALGERLHSDVIAGLQSEVVDESLVHQHGRGVGGGREVTAQHADRGIDRRTVVEEAVDSLADPPVVAHLRAREVAVAVGALDARDG